MDRDWFKSLVCLMWIGLPLSALEYWSVWDRLPLRMAVHFDINWQPNGYTSREGALMLGLGIMGFLLIVGTLGALVAHALKTSAAAWALLVVFYVTLGVCWYGNHSIIRFNLSAAQVPHVVR
jgi:uncharacterized membrane protein